MALAQPESEVSAPLPVAAQGAVALSLKGLRKAFDGAAAILDGIDLTVRDGEAVALIGANGTGKSTLLRCCLRLVEPSSGAIHLLGEDLHSCGPRRLRRLRSRVGFVFQRHNLVPRLSALTNVIHGAQARGRGPHLWYQALAPRAVREEAVTCLERVGLARLAAQRVDRLSGGQSQRVAIARALMQRPAFVIADEPVASLDPAAGEEIMELFVRLMREDGITLLFTSHNLRHALSYAERIVALKDGVVALDAPTRSQRLDDLAQFFRNAA